MKLMLMLALTGCATVFVVRVSAFVVKEWWTDRVHAPDPELDEALDPYRRAWRE